jgi:hypothetical protein
MTGRSEGVTEHVCEGIIRLGRAGALAERVARRHDGVPRSEVPA